MPMDKEIKIRSGMHSELNSRAVIGGKEYIVVTENVGKKSAVIVTRVYQKGEIVSTNKTDYGSVEKLKGTEKALNDLMAAQHRMTMKMLDAEKRLEAKGVSDYMAEVKDLLRRKNPKSALALLNEATERHPDDPFILSYQGCLLAMVEKKHDQGVATCRKAIEQLNRNVPFGQDFFYPSFYLNLGRAYLAAGRKDEAVKALNQGLKYDRDNGDLLWELKKMGTRRRPTVPFLGRSNPINKYMGMVLDRLTR